MLFYTEAECLFKLRTYMPIDVLFCYNVKGEGYAHAQKIIA